MKKGKILKVRIGHEANCSSGMFLLAMFYLSALTHLPTALITSGIQARQAKSSGEIDKKTKSIPQVIGLIITVGLFIFGLTSGFDTVFLGLMAVVFGGGFALAVYLGNKLAPKIGYWNILVVPLIQAALVCIMFYAVMYFPYY